MLSSTARPLSGCSLTGSFFPTATAFDPTIASLRYQAEVLGIQVVHEQPSTQGEALSYRLGVPGLDPITCIIDGWANGDSRGASELTVQAAVGLMSVHGRASGHAQGLGVNYVSTLSASLALTGAIATALGRLRGTTISNCRISLAAAGLMGVSQYLAGATVEQEPEQLLPGCTSALLRPPFKSLDGIVFELETLDSGPWRAFWDDMEVPREDVAKGWHGFLMRYAKAIAPVPASLCEALAKLPYSLIVDRCQRAGLSICPVRDLKQRLTDHSLEQGPWAFALSSRETTPNRPCKGNLPMSGLTVIESCRRIQGPLAGHLLSLLGAQVVRLELPGGDPLRGMAPLVDGCSVRFDVLNYQKQVVEVDIKSAEGRAEILRLVHDADVFLHNWAPGKAAELALDQADLASVNPSLIYAYAGGWGSEAPQDMPGTDFMVQAWSGVAQQIAQFSDTPGGSLFTVLDVLGGVVAAQGITAALLARQLKRVAGRVDSSLLGGADLLCQAQLQQLRDGLPATEPLLCEVFATAEGLVAIECLVPRHLDQLALTLDYPPSAEGAELDAHIRQRLQTRPAVEWQAALQARGVPVSVVASDLVEVLKNPRLQDVLSSQAYTRVNAPWSFT